MDKKTIKIKRRQTEKGGRPLYPILTIYEGKGAGLQFYLDGATKIIGREAGVDIYLDDDVASRRHALLEMSATSGFFIKDLESTNGTLVNHEEITSARLEDGDWIRIGETVMRFQYVDELTSQLIEKTAKDPLTGLWNKERFQQDLSRARLRADDADSHLSLLIIDLDHFKKVNDTHGHRCGDQVLKRVARLFSTSLGDDDRLYRYGGEEFSVIIPDKEEKEALRTAELLRGTLEEEEILFEGRKLSLTVSVGLLTVTGEGTTPAVKALIDMTDQALYHAKNSGRNKVVSRTVTRGPESPLEGDTTLNTS